MCGRYMTRIEAEWEWELDEPPPLFASYNIAPSTRVPAVRTSRGGGREAALMRWGLIPFWAKGEPPRYATINATCERLQTAPAYRGPWKQERRCLLPALGFYEWQVVAGQSRKQPWFIRVAGGGLFALGGLWERSRRADGTAVESCTIITVPANGMMAEIHNAKKRMPLIVHPDAFARWLGDDSGTAEGLMRPYPESRMEAWPVGPFVNSPRNDDARCCAPARSPLFDSDQFLERRHNAATPVQSTAPRVLPCSPRGASSRRSTVGTLPRHSGSHCGSVVTMKKEGRAGGIMSFVVAASALALVLGAGPSAADPWRFGIMSDTQWKANLDGENPETVAVGIIRQINRQFIDHDVKFVIQVGDLVDKETDSTNGHPGNRTMDTRAAAAQPLYDAGICFFPLRGNHEGSALAAQELPVLFPQTMGPDHGGLTCGATNFTSPFELLEGLSYSFDYGNARFVMLDQFIRPDGSNYNGVNYYDNMLDQMGWFGDRLDTKGGNTHGFVFSHKNLMGANHSDILFGSDPTANPDAQNRFFASMEDGGARYHFGGHDHNHTRSIIVSPDGQSSIQDIITSSNSYKFYTPDIPSHDEAFNDPLRETVVVQELYTVGYYIVTVDGPRVSVDHYASTVCGQEFGQTEPCSLKHTPELDFHKRETFGYSLNGQEFLVAQGGSYTVVQDSFAGTKAEILDGFSGSTEEIHDHRHTSKAVDTGWTPKSGNQLASHVLTLWGMGELGSDQTDTFVLSMSYDKKPIHQGNGGFGIATRDEEGRWVNAVDMNFGGAKTFVHGPWRPGYGLGTYGIDPSTKTVWAAVNYNGDFAVTCNIEAVPGHRKH